MRRLDADGWTALALLALCVACMSNLLASDATGAFLTSASMPIAVVAVLTALSLLLLAGSVFRMRAAPLPTDQPGSAINWKVPAMVLWLVFYVAALPWLGYLPASAAFLVGAGLLYGNRRWLVLAATAIALPGILLLFFEKVMIVLLPASRLWS